MTKKEAQLELERQAVDAARKEISPLGNAAAILGYHLNVLSSVTPLRRKLALAVDHIDKANALLNKVVYPPVKQSKTSKKMSAALVAALARAGYVLEPTSGTWRVVGLGRNAVTGRGTRAARSRYQHNICPAAWRLPGLAYLAHAVAPTMEPILTESQRRLKALHGTPEEFAMAVTKAIGEISEDEASAAITKYFSEWAGRDAGCT